MTQTAVEWLVKELNQKIDFIPMDKWDVIRDIVQQAKAMEKEQMFSFTRHYHIIGESTNVFYKHEFEQYYNETYGTTTTTTDDL